MKLLTIVSIIAVAFLSTGNASALVWEDFEGVTPPALPTGSWTFSDSGELAQTTVSGGPTGNYLRMNGTDTNVNYYLGGWGNYKVQNWSTYTDFSANVLGSGNYNTFKYELQEVDGDIFAGGDWGSPTYTPLTWTGWQQVILPLSGFTDRNPGVGDNVWTGNLQQIGIIAAAGTAGGTFDAGVDNVSAIPEPTSLLLLGSGLVGLLGLSLRRKVK